MNKTSLFLLSLVAFSGQLTWAGSITSSDSATVELGSGASLYTANCGYSSSVCNTNFAYIDNVPADFSLTIPGVALPDDSTITSATLTTDFPDNSAPVSECCGAGGPAECGFGGCSYTYPDLFAFFTASGYFSEATSPDNSASLGDSPTGTYDLLALGFGADIAAGDAITLSGVADTTFGPWGYNSTGYNSYFYVQFDNTATGNPVATLDVEYSSTPEPGTLFMLGTGLLGLGATFRRRISSPGAGSLPECRSGLRTGVSSHPASRKAF